MGAVKTLVIATGGTGGHLMPSLALAEEARERGYRVLFITGGEKVRGLLNGYQRVSVKSGELLGGKNKLREATRLIRGFAQSLSISLDHLKEVPFVAAGSFATLPVLLSMSFLGLPFFLLEQNAIPGKTVRLFSGRARGVFLSFEEAGRYLRTNRLYITGNPIRKEVIRVIPREEAKSRLGIPLKRPVVLVLGGSLGAISLVKEAIEIAPQFRDAFFYILTGERNYGQFEVKRGENFLLVPFQREMNCVYSASEIAISRAGGSTIAELAYYGIPVILVPYPHAADNHQLANALAVQKKGGAYIVEERNFKEGKLVSFLKRLLGSSEEREKMRYALLRLSRPQAASCIMDIIEEERGALEEV
jgi:UDP-N-acetylglucosamine--N-acetylmuramyl-(pentapeptide) pyrophosphoryl-undecaprenol N-acetylglucosamine transferase